MPYYCNMGKHKNVYQRENKLSLTLNNLDIMLGYLVIRIEALDPDKKIYF